MKFRQTFLLALPALTTAYPGMGSTSKAEMLEHLQKRHVEEAALQKRQSPIDDLIGTVAALTKTISGLVGAIANNISPNNKRPEPGYEYRAPGSGDSRGPCPGLNLLANHGYLPRNGYVTFQQVLDATSRGFNMGADLATILATFAVLTDGDIATESFYLGSLTGADGLNRHSTVEADVSPNREDYYNGCGDNHHLSSRLFKQNVGFAAADPSKQFTLDVMTKQYAANAQFSKDNNPYLYYVPFPMIVSLGAFPFYPNFFSNGTYGAGGVANYESISSIVGAQYNPLTGDFIYVPERWPQNWYRRATPYTAAQALSDAFLKVYPANIIVPGASQVGTPNLNPQTLVCNVYQGINSVLPFLAGGTFEDTSKLITYATNKLLPVFGQNSAFGCPDTALSPNVPNPLFPNVSSVGGPQNSPPKSDAKTGNNVYGRVYFGTAPKTPAC